mgnify:CR=1 FL=1
MVLLGLIFLAACFGVVGQAVRRWFPQASAAAYLLAVAAVALGSQFYYLLLRPVQFMNMPSSAVRRC